ncbi:DUF6356 family protein [Allosphingosinicella vermicomposti]|uniref:DUF6356 family protein n=1 Tax=Allosphingosinicella vermicomposti TaxID=614671 RepID=UPI0018F87E32|nr:DUF6356 family protein [Allosphingosinicella vermicomposti]
MGTSRRHLVEVGESYFDHLRFAATVGRLMVAGGIACLIHAFIPALFPTTASKTIRALHAVLDDRRNAAALVERDVPPFGPLLLLSLSGAASPWAAGAEPVMAAALSILALGFPVAFLIAMSDRDMARAD